MGLMTDHGVSRSQISGLADERPQTSDWDRDWDRCGGVRSGLSGGQVCGHNVPTILPVSPTFGEPSPGRWRDMRMVVDG